MNLACEHAMEVGGFTKTLIHMSTVLLTRVLLAPGGKQSGLARGCGARLYHACISLRPGGLGGGKAMALSPSRLTGTD